MKKTIILIAACAALLGTAYAQNDNMSREELQKSFRQTIQKRDISQRHLETSIPLGPQLPQTKSGAKALPHEQVWFPGEWEEVQAICVTPYYTYLVPGYENSGTWMADPLVSGYAQYYEYRGGWQERDMGPYKSVMDTTSRFGLVFFRLMDGIQMGGAEAWVRVEHYADTAIVLRTLERMNLRHDNVRFIFGKGNSFWFRDCGPIAFYYGDQDSVGMLDFTYYPGRALDDSLPSLIHWQMGIPNYQTDIEWEGGNCLVDGAGMVLSSDAIYSSNNDRYGQITWDGQDINTINYKQVTPLSRAQVKAALQSLLGQRATYILPAYRYDGGTGHVDLYADAYDENGFVFSVMPDDYSSWTDYRTGKKNIDSLCSYSSVFDRDYYTMATLPFPSRDNGSNFTSQSQYNSQFTRTYSNHTFVNNVILQPCFSIVGSDGMPTSAWDRANIEQIQQAYPGYTIYCVDVRDFDGSGGAIHCVTKQIPAENPIRILHKNLHDTVALGTLTAIPVSAIITNKSGIASAEIKWREADSSQWNTISLTADGNRFHGQMPLLESAMHTIEYYISATSNNGKTITKPMTASQGGYYSFTYSVGGTMDSTDFDFDTTAMPMENITFAFDTAWSTPDSDTPRVMGITAAASGEERFGQFYPNPAAGQAKVNIEMEQGKSYTVSIIDVAGRTVHTGSLQASGSIVFCIDAARLGQGQYTVVFTSDSERIVRKLIVK